MKVATLLLVGVGLAAAQVGFGGPGARRRPPMTPRAMNVGNKFADGTLGLTLGMGTETSGCGIHRTCYQCKDQPGCSWAAEGGCILSDFPSFCGLPGDSTIAKACPEIQSCGDCTTQSGCVWYRAKCQYSRGQGCLHDPINCVNFDYQCPAGDGAAPVAAAAEPEEATSLAELALLGSLLNGGGGIFGSGRSYGRPRYGGDNFMRGGFAGSAYPAQIVQPTFGGRPSYPGVVSRPNYGGVVSRPNYGGVVSRPSYGGRAYGGRGGNGGFMGGGFMGGMGGSSALGPLLASQNLGMTGGIPGLGMFDNIDVGLASGLLIDPVNVHATTNDDEITLMTGQSLLCQFGDLYCNSAANDPYAPHNLGVAQDLLSDLGLPHANLQFPEYNVPAPFTAPNFNRDYNQHFNVGPRPAMGRWGGR